MENDKNYKELLKNLLPTIRKINELETQKTAYQLSILEQELSKEEIKSMVDRKIYKDPLDIETNYLCNKIYFGETNEKDCPLEEKCEYITKLMGNNEMLCEVLYKKLKNEL